MMAERVAIPTPAGTFDALAAGPEDGPAVLLLHGFPECADQWEHQLAALAGAGYRAVAFDQRGYSPGVRPAEVDAYGSEKLIGDVLAVADALGWTRFDLVGHDWGSAVAWMTAAAHPARLRTLTAVSTPHGAALVQALRDDPDQRRRSAYFELFRTPGEAERELLEEGGLRRLYDGLPAHRMERYVERFSEPGALTAALTGIARCVLRRSAGRSPPPRSTSGARATPSSERRRRAGPNAMWPGLTASRSSKASRTGSQRRRPSDSRRS